MLDLDPFARGTGAAAISGIGLVPGLSNILARYLRDRVGRLSIVDIHLMLGLGDMHGVDAIRWMLDYADRSFTVQTPAGPASVETFSGPKVVYFPDESAPRTTYRFDFADQHVIPYTLGADGSSTRVCFDSRLMTKAVALLKRAGLIDLAQRADPYKIAKFLRMLRLGTDAFTLKVEALGVIGNLEVMLTASAQGHDEARATGTITSLVAQRLYDGYVPAGVHHAEQVTSLERFVNPLNEAGIHLHLPSS